MSYNPYTLQGKTILVTGAASGIGQTTAIECSKMGASVIITDINEVKLHKTLLLINEFGQSHTKIVADLTKEEEIIDLVKQLPNIDGCVNNAGVMKLVPVQFITTAEIDNIYKINLFAPILLTKHLVKLKKMKRPSSIVFTASVGGVFRVSVGNGIYATSKCGIDGFMRTSALELASQGIRCNSVNPGMVDTDLINKGQLTIEQIEQDKKNYPLGRYGKPQDIAHAIIFLLSDASSWITGTALKIDGGMTLS